MIVSINQPAYLPWLGYFDRIANSDKHIVLDHVQFEKNSYTNRNKVRTRNGCSWLTVPVATKGNFGNLRINQLKIANARRWASKHWATLRESYSKALCFGPHAAFFEHVYQKDWQLLNDLLRETTAYLSDHFGIRTPVLFSSQLSVEGRKDELVLNLCRLVGASVYLSGPLGRSYLREELFREAGIKVIYHEYRHPTYMQVDPGFEPYMSAVDLLFNCGDRSREILMSRQQIL